MDTPEPKKASIHRRWPRRLGIAAGILGVMAGGVWYGVNHTAWMGPMVADGLRSVLGPGFVAWAEDTAYAVQDRVNRWRYKDQKPKTFWEAPTAAVLPPEPPPAASSDKPGEQPFFPASFAPPFAEVAATGDGVWAPLPDADEPTLPPLMYRSLVHPDPRRGFGVLAVVAIDRASVGIHLVAGTTEPDSPRVNPKERRGSIPKEHLDALFAAFNGGFKATHGQYGMLLDGKEYLPPRDHSCTFVHYKDGRLAIAPWAKLKTEALDTMLFYRQTPPCLVQEGEVDKMIESNGEYAKGWGATVSGETVIRRSAIGISNDGKTLFYGIGDAMTAQSLARGMKAAGSYAAAELDVNYSYPRFLTYAKGQGATPTATQSLIPGVDFTKDQYVAPSPRDFFYLTRERKKPS
jgi:hypothetical protein